MYNEPKQRRYTLNNPSIKKALRIANKYDYKVALVRVGKDRAFLSVSEPLFRSPYPRHFTSVIRTAKYVK